MSDKPSKLGQAKLEYDASEQTGFNGGFGLAAAEGIAPVNNGYDSRGWLKLSWLIAIAPIKAIGKVLCSKVDELSKKACSKGGYHTAEDTIKKRFKPFVER